MGSNPAAVRVFRNRPPRDLRQWFRKQPRTEGARQKNCFLWVPKVTGSILSGCVWLGMGSNPAAVPTGLQGTANGFGTKHFGTSLAPGAAKEPFFMGSKVTGSILSGCVLLGKILLLFECFGIRPPRDLRQWFRNQPRTEGARQKNCFLWVPKVTGSILSGCVLLGMGSNPAAVRVFRNRPPRDLRQWFRNQPRTEGARQKNCFLWVPKVTGSILSGCVLLGMGSNPAAVRVFRNRPPRDLRQWFRNQPRTEGARQKNCFLWVPKVTGSILSGILSGCVLLGMGSNPAAVRVFRNRSPRDLRQWFRNQPRTEGARQKNCFLWVPKVTGSILSGCVLLGMGSNPAAVRVFRNRPPRDLRQWFRNQPRTEGARQKNCFLWVPKVTGSILSGCVLLGMGSNPAAVRVFRNRPPRDLREWFRNQLESCCCSSVSEPASKGLAPMVSEPASHRGCQTKELFLMGSKGDGKHFVGLMTSKPGLVLDHPCSRKHQINYNCINEQLEVSPFAPQGEGSAAWAVALQSGSAVLCRRPSHLWL